MILPLLLLLFAPFANGSVICYQCHANSTDEGRFCSIDKLCKGTSCFFQLNANNSWSAGCSTVQTVNSALTCSSNSCSCNSDFCNSLAKFEAAINPTVSTSTSKGSWFGSRNSTKSQNVTLTLPDRSLVHCEECGSVTVDNETVVIPCDRNHTCRGNYCVSIRGQSPYSYCGGVWDQEKAPACYFEGSEPEMCICSNHMCNELLDPAPLWTTTVLADPTLATLATVAPLVVETVSTTKPTTTTTQSTTTTPTTTTTTTPGTTATTVKPTTKKKCKSSKLSPNDQAVFMGEKLKDAILGGFGGDDGAVQNFEDDINDHICNYSDDDED